MYTPPSAIEMLGVPASTARILGFFARNPTARPTVRELQRTLGVASASAQRDLARLVRGGALRVDLDGRMRRYAPRIDHSLWPAVRLLVEPPATTQPARVRERARKYDVDLGQLESMLLLTVEERLVQLDANATFLTEARRGRSTPRQA